MNELKRAAFAALTMVALLSSCASYNAYERARTAEDTKDWDKAVEQYAKALEIDPGNSRYRMAFTRAKLEASRTHFEKGRTLRAAANAASGDEQVRLMQLAATELQITVKLDPTNQYAAVELGKAISFLNDAARAASERTSIDEIKKRAQKENITKAQPPVLNPASDEPISLSFPHDTPVKDIYRALGNAFGINILFDQAVKDDRISIELRDVTAQQALERVMQAANHFYKVLDPKTIIVVPDNPQARRDYEDLVIQTFYLSNGDAEQVTNVVRTMIEARNVFPLKALNAITIRDTADKVRIAQKIIEANDKARAEVVVDVELIQLDYDKLRDIGFALQGPTASSPGQIIPQIPTTDSAGKVTITPAPGGTQVTLGQLRALAGPNSFTFTMPSAQYALAKTLSNAELLANPELRISEGEKATLHIGQRIPVPVSTFTAISTGTSPYQPVVSYQYQDVGIKVSIEPRVHHNQEVTLKLTVEVSNQGPPVVVPNQAPQPTFATRTIESTIRLKDGETNFLAGLIQDTKNESSTKTPFLGDIPFIGRLFNLNHQEDQRTDLILTMTPHIVRMPDITEDDLAPMWVGTQNNMTFRGVSPRIESNTQFDPFTPNPNAPGRVGGAPVRATPVTPAAGDMQGNVPVTNPPVYVPPGTAPTNPFAPPPKPQGDASLSTPDTTAATKLVATSAAMPMPDEAAMRLSPRIEPQPTTFTINAGQQKNWTVVGMDLEGLTTSTMSFRYDPRAINIQDVMFGPAMNFDPKAPPVAMIDNDIGVVKIQSSDGKPLSFRSGGELMTLKLQGVAAGDAPLVLDTPELKNAQGQVVVGAISGGRARVE